MLKASYSYYFFFSFFVLFSSCKNNSENTSNSISVNEPSFKKEADLWFINKEEDTLTQLEIEIADSDYEYQTGLMYRKEMKANRGMLFIYNEEQVRPNFYMKNTYIPLDLIYINSAFKIVDINRNAQPMNESPIPSEAASQYVLEVNAGMADQWKISLGDRAVFKRE